MKGSSGDYLKHLNEEQKFAVTHTEGPMLILAGAGSGKTRTITYKIAYLIDQGICRAERILAVTFTNKAAEEMRSRVEALLTHLAAAPLVCTFHSFCVRVLRQHADLIGYRRDFTICDREDQKRVLKIVYQELNLRDSNLSLHKACATISWAKNKNWSPKVYRKESGSSEKEEISRIYGAYQRFLKRSNAVDFDDLLLLTGRLLKKHRDVRERYGEWYQYFLVDEYQDTNRPQYDLIKNLTCVHQNISVVGDEDQSIYGFRGADIGNILRFETDFATATIVKLEQNYRSNQNILDAATGLVSNNVHRKGKVLWTQKPTGEPLELFAAPDARAEAYFVSQKIYQHLQEGEKGLAVLYRTNFQSRQFEEFLRRFDIPYNLIGGVSFYHRKEIKDALAYLRVAVNPDDNVSLMRIINEPPRGIGRVTMDRLQQMARDERTTLWGVLCKGLEENVFPARTHLALERFFKLIRRSQEFIELPLHLSLDKTLEASGYVEVLRREDSEESHNRILNLKELVTVAKEQAVQGYTLQEFLDQAALRSEADDYDQSAAVRLMTLHNAKGLEFPIVFLVGCEEGLFPHSRSLSEEDLEEERRLCYVGLTRAQKRIYLTYSRRRRFFGREGSETNSPSRFLKEIPKHLVRDCSSPLASLEFVQPNVRFGDSSYRRRGQSRFSGKTYDSVESVRGFLQELSQKRAVSHRRFVSGAEILHQKLGYGRILHVQDTGNDLKITVKFPGIGIKKFLQSYARLKLV